MDPLIEEEEQTGFFNPVTFVFQFLASYGWYLVGASALGFYAASKLKPKIDAWKQAREDAEYHKDPDKAMARMEAIQRAREKQQQLLLAASQRAAEEQKEKEERKRREAAERLEKYGSTSGQRLGSNDDGYLPLSGGASTSSYKAPKRSACAKGGCGR
ncbi:unnamed protein product [Plutella xylostella]|uniref:(diamondback moth) hypothetical protein n=1 Tax=Plutella xylostella TaxID=51655 RepID=A0A8S4DWU6_PLUXY|nr:unnamed protein product [Plutella xylostella]